MSKLQLLQNSACRTLLCTVRDAHVADMPQYTGLLTIDVRRKLHFSFEIYKTNYACNVGLKRFYVPIVPVSGCVACQNKRNVVVPKVRTSMGQRAVSVRGPVFWNNLPLEAKLEPKFVTFKRIVSSMGHQLFGDHPT